MRPGHRVNSVLSNIEPTVDPVREVEPEPSATGKNAEAMPEQAPAWFKDYINRLEKTKPNGPRPPPFPGGSRSKSADRKKKIRIEFKGCWHCGTDGHPRGGCEILKNIMADATKGNFNRDTWKLPQGYLGAFKKAKEKAHPNAKKRVNMFDGTSGDESGTEADDWEDSDEDLMGSDYGQTLRAIRRTPPKLRLMTDAYSGCNYDDAACGADTLEKNDIVDDGEVKLDEEAHRLLSNWDHRTFVDIRKKKSRLSQKAFSVHSADDLDKLFDNGSKIAKMVAKGNPKNFEDDNRLPDIPLEDDEMVALVDSGSTLNAAHIAKHFTSYIDRIVASRAQAMGESATTAGGHKLVNEGRCRVEATVDGE